MIFGKNFQLLYFFLRRKIYLKKKRSEKLEVRRICGCAPVKTDLTVSYTLFHLGPKIVLMLFLEENTGVFFAFIREFGILEDFVVS